MAVKEGKSRPGSKGLDSHSRVPILVGIKVRDSAYFAALPSADKLHNFYLCSGGDCHIRPIAFAYECVIHFDRYAISSYIESLEQRGDRLVSRHFPRFSVDTNGNQLRLHFGMLFLT